MNNSLIELFLFFQIFNIILLFLEWSSVFENCSKKIMIGRIFILLLPTLVIISLMIRPLEQM